MTSDPAQQFPANPDQAEYWNSGGGQQWVTHQAALDARLKQISDLLFVRCAARARRAGRRRRLRHRRHDARARGAGRQ